LTEIYIILQKEFEPQQVVMFFLEKFKPLSISNFEKTKTNYSLYE